MCLRSAHEVKAKPFGRASPGLDLFACFGLWSCDAGSGGNFAPSFCPRCGTVRKGRKGIRAHLRVMANSHVRSCGVPFAPSGGSAAGAGGTICLSVFAPQGTGLSAWKVYCVILHSSLPVVKPPHGAKAGAKFPPEPASQGSDTEASEEVKAGRRPPRSGLALTV